MKKLLVSLAGLVLASAALAAQIDPTRPMVTGHGNVAARPGKIIVTNQTAAKPDDPIALEGFVVTGSLIHQPAKENPRRQAVPPSPAAQK